MPDNYYQRIISEIEKAISEQDYGRAEQLLKEEMRMPYIPSDVQKKLEKLQKELSAATVKERQLPLLDDAQLAEKLRGSEEERYLALDSLARSNIRAHLKVIQDYLADDDADRLMVSLLLEQCMLQQVANPLTYRENGQTITVIPAQLRAPLDYEILQQSWKHLAELFENHNPSFLQQCQQVLVQYGYRHYPSAYEEGYLNLTYGVVRYVFRAYGDEEGWKRFAGQFAVNIDDIKELSL
ncbi:MAG: DUF3196 family protein [Erysipelotrichaceae bacterium]|nr:DUF3196 family protein [Erysipelotrichaceae bacterium]